MTCVCRRHDVKNKMAARSHLTADGHEWRYFKRRMSVNLCFSTWKYMCKCKVKCKQLSNVQFIAQLYKRSWVVNVPAPHEYERKLIEK